MSLTIVVPFSDSPVVMDNADSWERNTDGSLTVTKTNGGVTTHLAEFAPESWLRVLRSPKEDKQLKLDEALELLREVDDGNYGHQDSDWVKRAEALLDL